MAYDFATRRLSFLKSRPLVAVVELLAECATVEEALAAAGIPDGQRPRYLRALEELAASGMLTPAPVPAGAPA
jgi:putative mycofactocin binding protein MftB